MSTESTQPTSEPPLQVVIPPSITLLERIGKGTFSEVYEALNNDTNEVIALKCIRQKMLTLANYRQSAKEISIMKILKHKNILQLNIYYVGKTVIYIGTECAAHGSLANYIDQESPVPENQIKFVMKQLISALDFIHSLGVFHGDLKPANILCMEKTQSGPFIKICDFGLSEVWLKDSGPMIFKAGSYYYMAPEIILQSSVDCTCDLWSAGVVMYCMMFNRNLFCLTDKDTDKFQQMIRRKISPVFNGSERFSKECKNLVKNLLSYDKLKRLTGENLRKHPFLEIQSSTNPSNEFVGNATKNINKAFNLVTQKEYGEALVLATQAIIELKIHYNLFADSDHQNYFRKKWEEYEAFAHSMERVLAQPLEVELTCPENCSDKEFRLYLSSTPRLLDGFEIGCNAELFLMEGHREKALNMFNEALQVLLPLMKNEPKSNRKDLLGKRMKQWLQYIESLQKDLKESASCNAVAGPSSLGTRRR